MNTVGCSNNRFCKWFRNSKWLMFLGILLGQFFRLIMFTIWATDCFFREFHTTAVCEHFEIFPMPKLFEIFWLTTSSVGFVFLIYHIVRRSPAFCGPRKVICCLAKKKYFYKIGFVLLVVVVYDIFILLNSPKKVNALPAVLFMIEKTLTVQLMFFLNFLPR